MALWIVVASEYVGRGRKVSNNLSRDRIRAIQALFAAGFSLRQIGAVLGVDRKTARRYVAMDEGSSEEGTEPSNERKRANQRVRGATSFEECRRHEAFVLELLQNGLSVKEIHQRLTDGHGFEGSYWSLNRFVKELRQAAFASLKPSVPPSTDAPLPEYCGDN